MRIEKFKIQLLFKLPIFLTVSFLAQACSFDEYEVALPNGFKFTENNGLSSKDGQVIIDPDGKIAVEPADGIAVAGDYVYGFSSGKEKEKSKYFIIDTKNRAVAFDGEADRIIYENNIPRNNGLFFINLRSLKAGVRNAYWLNIEDEYVAINPNTKFPFLTGRSALLR